MSARLTARLTGRQQAATCEVWSADEIHTGAFQFPDFPTGGNATADEVGIAATADRRPTCPNATATGSDASQPRETCLATCSCRSAPRGDIGEAGTNAATEPGSPRGGTISAGYSNGICCLAERIAVVEENLPELAAPRSNSSRIQVDSFAAPSSNFGRWVAQCDSPDRRSCYQHHMVRHLDRANGGRPAVARAAGWAAIGHSVHG